MLNTLNHSSIGDYVVILLKPSVGFLFSIEYIPEKLEGQKHRIDTTRQLFSALSSGHPLMQLLQAAERGLSLRYARFLSGMAGKLSTVQRTVGEISRCTCQTGNIEKSSHILQNYILDGAKAEGMPISRMLGKAGVLQVICMLAACALCTLSDLPLQVFTEGILILWLLTATGFITKIQKHHMNEGSVFIV